MRGDGLRFLIIDGYPEESREELERAGMQLAWKLYANMLQRLLPGAAYDVWLASDTEQALPEGRSLTDYAGIMWTGCNLTIYHEHDARVTRQIDFAKEAYAAGVPSFGTCWGIQMAAVAAGGVVEPNPKGREMGVARGIRLTAEGAVHPFMEGKPPVYEGFISHVDEVVGLPDRAMVLAEGDFTRVQALAVRHRKGVFWALQYHPEYDLHEMARLIVAREPKLVPEGFFRDGTELAAYVEKLEALAAEPGRKDLRWQLAIGDGVLDQDLRQREVRNWLEHLVLPEWRRR